MSIPPSPALSFCDTLSSPDLDAYLDNLPPLSLLPSPIMKDAWWKDERAAGSARHDSMVDDQQSYDSTSANVLCAISSCSECEAVKALRTMVTQFLANCQLPLETVAIAYNILASPRVVSLHCWHGLAPAFAGEGMREKMVAIHGSEADASCQRALIILSALSVAVSFSEDCPRSVFYWSRHVGEGAFSTEQVSAMNRLLLNQLDWQIHPLTAPGPVQAAVNALSKPLGTLCKTPQTSDAHSDESSFKLLISPHTVMQHGLLTPEPSPSLLRAYEERVSFLNPV